MAKAIPIEQMHSAIQKILNEYGEDVSNGTRDAVRAVAQKGATAVRANARATFGGSGRYASGWTYQSEYSRMKSTAVIYNKTPGLPHLLENGHAKRGGGRVMGRVHIAPVETEIEETLTKAIEQAVSK